MKIIKTRIKGLLIIKSKIYNDKRGFFKEIIKKKILNENFKFDCVSFSKKKTLRGLHIQLKNSQAKLITVSHGKIFDVVVDLRIKSKTFGKTFAINMSDKSDFSLFIPKGFAHGFQCLSKNCVVYYKNSSYQDIKNAKTLSWKDSDLNIKWPYKKPILSSKDRSGLSFKDIKKILK